MKYEIPFGAKPGFRTKYRIYPRDKKDNNKSLNFTEISEFGGVCQFGSCQLIACYGEDCNGEGYSRDDFMFMCNECPYYLGINAKYNLDYLISEPYFILKKYENEIDFDNPKYFVYFISDGEYVKIGIANDVAKRLSDLQVANARKLSALFIIPVKNKQSALKVESSLHLIYNRFSKNGEWFIILDVLNLQKFEELYSAKKYMVKS